MRSRWTLVAVGLLLAVACDDGPPLGPPDLLIEQLVGTWRGHHIDETNDISESVELTVARLAEDTVEIQVDFGPRGRGPDPEPETFVVTFEDGATAWSDFSAVLGAVNANLAPDGALDGVATGLGFRIEADGTLDAAAGRIEVFTFARRGGFAFSGRTVLCRDDGDPACEATEAIPPAASCEVVPEVASASMDCASDCVPPNGACIGGVCLQVCVPGECEGRCAGGETCVRAEFDGAAVTFSDGRGLGGCTVDDGGFGRVYELCGGPNGGCESDLKCLTLGASSVGICVPPCEADAECPPGPSGEPAGCDLYQDSTNRRFCGLRCTPTADAVTGDAECTGDLSCLASPAGGTCFSRATE